jgi:hypothetical protein
MKRITIDGEQCAELNGFDAPNEVCDPEGRVIGYLIPPARYAELLAAKEAVDIAELERRALDPDEGTLQELWRELGVNGPNRPGPGLCAEMMTIVADDDEHLKDFSEYMP